MKLLLVKVGVGYKVFRFFFVKLKFICVCLLDWLVVQEGVFSFDVNFMWLFDYLVLIFVECFVFEKFLFGVWIYVVVYIYSDNYIEVDLNLIVKRVFKLLLFVLFWMVVIGFWFFLFIFVGCFVIIGLLVVLIFIQVGVGLFFYNFNWIFVIMYMLFEILLFVCIFYFVFLDFVVVFELQNYG